MPRAPLTREDMDASACTDPECTNPECGGPTLLMMSSCHTSALTVLYDKRTGRLRIGCSECGGLVAEIAVARSELVQ